MATQKNSSQKKGKAVKKTVKKATKMAKGKESNLPFVSTAIDKHGTILMQANSLPSDRVLDRYLDFLGNWLTKTTKAVPKGWPILPALKDGFHSLISVFQGAAKYYMLITARNKTGQTATCALGFYSYPDDKTYISTIKSAVDDLSKALKAPPKTIQKMWCVSKVVPVGKPFQIDKDKGSKPFPKLKVSATVDKKMKAERKKEKAEARKAVAAETKKPSKKKTTSKTLDEDELILENSMQENGIGFFEDPFEAWEGGEKFREHKVRERSGALRKHKTEHALNSYGSLKCEICGFDFASEYPSQLGDGFIEVHHLKPVADLKPQEPTRLEDLMLICSNCHRMVHKTSDSEGNLSLLREFFTAEGT